MALFTNTIVELTLIELCLLGILVFCLLAQLYFSLFVHLKLCYLKIEAPDINASQPISIIICARNEAANLQKNLPAIFAQEYDDFEVIVVNDRSWDDTKEVLREFSKEHANLKTVTVGEGARFFAGKKFAATMGIKAARYEWLVFTDADATPASTKWLSGMKQPVDPTKEIVLGYSPFLKKGGLFNLLARFEHFFIAVNYFSFALKGMPYMGVGRNLAYKKSLFFKNKGFASHMHLPFGDDELFVNANANSNNTTLCIHPDTQIWAVPKTSFKDYLIERKRKAVARKFYKSKHNFILSMQVVTQFLFYVMLVAACFFNTLWFPALGIFVLSMVVRCFIYPRLLRRLSYPGLAWWFPVLDILLFIFLVFNGILSIFVKKAQWK